MAKTPSTMLALGTKAPDFSLPNPQGTLVHLADFRSAKALLVIFMCNHCPYVKHIAPALSQLAKDYQDTELAIIAINSNDVANYPEDHPDKMAQEIIDRDYIFPYLYDEDQSVAKAYQAACTPDFFLFDAEQNLVYRGQFDDSRPQNNQAVTGKDLRQAIEQTLAGQKPSSEQIPSLGCNIKWKSGNEPTYSRL